MRIGVLAIQGDVSEHVHAITGAMRVLGVDGQVVMVRSAEGLDSCAALLVPGGESTTIIKQVDAWGLRRAIIDMGSTGAPIMGTCAGCILLASRVDRGNARGGVEPLGLVDMEVERNAYGRQADSFEKDLEIMGMAGSFRGVFIRAPGIVKVGPDTEILASLAGGGERPVMVRQGNILGLTFHPELTGDTRVHEFFLQMVE